MTETLSGQTALFKLPPGYILTIPFIPEQIFKSDKEAVGEVQLSEVLSIGAELFDDNGISREPNCKVGDVISHKYTQDELVYKNTRYRFIHFSQVRGVLNDE